MFEFAASSRAAKRIDRLAPFDPSTGPTERLGDRVEPSIKDIGLTAASTIFN